MDALDTDGSPQRPGGVFDDRQAQSCSTLGSSPVASFVYLVKAFKDSGLLGEWDSDALVANADAYTH